MTKFWTGWNWRVSNYFSNVFKKHRLQDQTTIVCVDLQCENGHWGFIDVITLFQKEQNTYALLSEGHLSEGTDLLHVMVIWYNWGKSINKWLHLVKCEQALEYNCKTLILSPHRKPRWKERSIDFHGPSLHHWYICW